MRDIQSSSKRANRAGEKERNGQKECAKGQLYMGGVAWSIREIFCRYFVAYYLKFIVCENALKLNFLLAFVAQIFFSHFFFLHHINQCDKSCCHSPTHTLSTSLFLSLVPFFSLFSLRLFSTVLFVFFLSANCGIFF